MTQNEDVQQESRERLVLAAENQEGMLDMTLFVTYTGEETKSLSKSRHIEFSTRKPTHAEYMFMYYVLCRA